MQEGPLRPKNGRKTGLPGSPPKNPRPSDGEALLPAAEDPQPPSVPTQPLRRNHQPAQPPDMHLAIALELAEGMLDRGLAARRVMDPMP